MPSIASLKKAELVAAIQGLGEDPPAEWRVMELRNRLAELEEEKGVTRQTGKTKTNLQEWVVRLNYAAKKKVTLQQFMQNDLHMSLTGNETMAFLVSWAMVSFPVRLMCRSFCMNCCRVTFFLAA